MELTYSAHGNAENKRRLMSSVGGREEICIYYLCIPNTAMPKKKYSWRHYEDQSFSNFLAPHSLFKYIFNFTPLLFSEKSLPYFSQMTTLTIFLCRYLIIPKRYVSASLIYPEPPPEPKRLW